MNKHTHTNSKFYLASLTLLEEEISRGNIISLEASDKCMAPIINRGEKVFAKKIEPKSLRIGDIVIYKNKDALTAHRIILKRKASDQLIFLTKGDLYFKIDPPVNENQIMGKVIAVKKPDKILGLDSISIKFLNYLISLLSFFSIGVYKLTSTARRTAFSGKRPNWIKICSKVFWRVFYFPSDLVRLLSQKRYYKQ